MSLDEFIESIQLQKVYDDFILALNTVGVIINAETDETKKKTTRRRRKSIPKSKTAHAHEALMIQKIDNICYLKYTVSQKKMTRTSSETKYEECLVGYIQPIENGWVFVFLDSSHSWKKFRELLLKIKPDGIIVGANMFFFDSPIELDKRYHFLDKNEKIIPHAYVFKTGAVRMNDIYVASNRGTRYFVANDFYYSSDDMTTNHLLDASTYFKDFSEISNEDFLMIFDQKKIPDYEEVSRIYGEKTVHKLLKLQV